MVNDMEQQVITIQFLTNNQDGRKYWTVCNGNKPIASFASIKDAISAAPEAAVFNAHAVAA